MDYAIHKDWIETAMHAAIEAANAIDELYQTNFDVEIKADRSPVTIADKTSSQIILRILKETKIPIISEEETIPPFKQRSQLDWIWIVDPLDGTKEFIRQNDEFCVCIALIYQSQPVFGILADPVKKMILAGGESMGAFYFPFGEYGMGHSQFQLKNIKSNKTKIIAHSRSHFSEKTKVFIESIEKDYGEVDFIKKGSALKFVDLCIGKADFYPRMAPTMEWDIAAGDAIYRSIGGEVLDFTKFEPLKYNKENLYNPYFIARNKHLKQ